jgi:hypothetical protein
LQTALHWQGPVGASACFNKPCVSTNLLFDHTRSIWKHFQRWFFACFCTACREVRILFRDFSEKRNSEWRIPTPS